MYNCLYALPGLGLEQPLSAPTLRLPALAYPAHAHNMAYLAISLCVGSLAGLSSQRTPRLGKALGTISVSGIIQLQYDLFMHLHGSR